MTKIPYIGKLYLLGAVILLCLPSFCKAIDLYSNKLLVASGTMTVEPFAESVIFVNNHSFHSAMGVIINKPLEEIPEGFPEEIASSTLPLYYGGPVGFPQSLFVLRTVKGHFTLEQWDPDFYGHIPMIHEMEKRVETENLKVMVGYAGWAPLQLDFELMRGRWGYVEADPVMVNNIAVPELWKQAVKWTLKKAPENSETTL